MSSSQEPSSTPMDAVSLLFANGGEMGRLCREAEWAATPLGPVDAWPPSLKTTAATVLRSGFPMILVWGPELIQIYNDAYIPLIGQKHPSALAMPTHACWPEVRHLQEPIFRQVFNGETVNLIEAHYPLARNGILEDFYFDATFVPVPLETGEIGGSVSTLLEVTSRVTARALEADREKFRLIVEHSNDAHALLDSEARFLWANRLMSERLGYTLEELQTLTIADISPQFSLTRYQDVFERARRQRVPPVEAVHRRKDGTTFPVEITPTAVELAEGVRMSVAVRDITEHARHEARVEFLADASAVLAGSLDVEETLRQLTRVVVERLADACAIDLASGEGTLQRVSVLSQDPQKVEIAQELERRYPTPLDSPAGHTTAFRTGEAQLTTEFPDELLHSASRDEEHFRLWKALEMEAVINAPLVARGRTLGVITLVSHTPGRLFDQGDVDLALDLASRAALAIDNAQLYTQSQEANRAKTEFLSAMSHELRTPLNAIAGYIDLIDLGVHGPVTGAQRHALERIKRNQEDLLRLINDVLHFAKLEAGRMEFAIADMLLTEILEGITSGIEPQAQARGIAFSAHACDPSLTARADADRVRQILLNLVGNSLKFTAPGGWVLLRCDADPERVYMHVQDNGRGIPRDRLEVVFDPFVQLERHRYDTSQQGVGLGLAISRDLARGMGGDLVAESEEAVGSTFTLVLPRGQA